MEPKLVNSSSPEPKAGFSESNQKQKIKKLVLFLVFSIPVLILLLFLTSYLRTGNFNFSFDSPRLIPLYILFALNLGVALWLIRFMNRKVEMSSKGITETIPFGNTVFISWDEIGQVMTDVGGIVRVKDKTGQKTIKLLKFSENFEYMKLKVFEACEKNRTPLAKENDIYAMGTEVGPTYLIGGIVFLGFSGLFFFEAIRLFLGLESKNADPLVTECFFSIAGIATAAFAIYALWAGPRLKESKIEITASGIARLEKDGSNVFIRWEDVSRLTKRDRLKQIGVYSLDPSKKILVDYQFDGFEKIRDRIFEEFMKRLKLPVVRTTYGQSLAIPNLYMMGLALIVSVPIFLIVCSRTTIDSGVFLVFIPLLVLFIAADLIWESKLPKGLILNGNEITLRFLFSDLILQTWEVSGVQMESASGRNGIFYTIQLITEAGKKYTFAEELSAQLSVYLVLKKWLELRKYETHS